MCKSLWGPTKAWMTAGSPSACDHSGHGTKGQGCRLVRLLESVKLQSCASFPRLPPSGLGQEQPAQEWDGAATQRPHGTSRLRGRRPAGTTGRAEGEAACRDCGAWGSGQGSRPGQWRHSLHRAFVACGDSATRLQWLLPDACAALRPGQARGCAELGQAPLACLGAASSEPQVCLATPLMREGKWPA